MLSGIVDPNEIFSTVVKIQNLKIMLARFYLNLSVVNDI